MDRLIGKQFKHLSYLSLSILSFSAFAQDAAKTGYVATQSHSNAGGGSFVWLTLVTLFLAAILIALVAWYVKRSLNIDMPNSAIQILASQSVGPRERILIVQIADRAYAIGHTPSHISLISELDDLELATLPKSAPNPSSEFTKKLSEMVRKGIKV